MERRADLQRIARALAAAGTVLRRFVAGSTPHRTKAGGSPVSEADLAVDAVLRETLPCAGEGWLSEETADDPRRLDAERVWVVDPLDGTQEFVAGIPEWCVSVGLVERGKAVAGGILVPPAGLTLIGSIETGVTLNGAPCAASARVRLEGAEVLASRSETARGEWARFRDAPFHVRPTGSVAHKLALVAAGRADATWSFVGKHEWDVAAGVALVEAAGGEVFTLDGHALCFNQPEPLVPGLCASGRGLAAPLRAFLG